MASDSETSDIDSSTPPTLPTTPNSTVSGTSSGSNIASTTLQPSFVIPTHLFESVPAPTLYWSFSPAIQTQISSNPTQDYPQSSRGARRGSRRGRGGGNPGDCGVGAGAAKLPSSQPINTGKKSSAGVLGPHPSTLPLVRRNRAVSCHLRSSK